MPSSPRILIDENVPFAVEAFGPFGEIVRAPGRAISAALARDFDVLVVRSVTRVDAALLESSRVRFVGTATIGTDHVDAAWLASRGIAFASAPGSNAESVAQYVAAALLTLRADARRPLRGASLGIVGAGHCGSRVARVGRALGMHVVACDPPLARTGFPPPKPILEWATLDAALACDYVSMHVPLTREGPDRTTGLLDSAAFSRMKPGAALIHACRGGVVDEDALLAALASRRLSAAALDTWVGEPCLRADTLRAVRLASPHVAGYSRDGKARGTEAVHRALCDRLGAPSFFTAEAALSSPPRLRSLDPRGRDPEDATAEVVLEARPVHEDDAALRATADLDAEARGRRFDELRARYPERREFAATRVLLAAADARIEETLRGLGFDVVASAPSPGVESRRT